MISGVRRGAGSDVVCTPDVRWEEEPPAGNTVYELAPGILRMSPASIHDSDTILASKRIFNPFLGIWVIAPGSINPKTVFIPPGW